MKEICYTVNVLHRKPIDSNLKKLLINGFNDKYVMVGNSTQKKKEK